MHNQDSDFEDGLDQRGAQARYIALALLAGSLAGIFGSLFHLTIKQLITWPTHLANHTSGVTLVLLSALIAMAVTVLSVFIVRRFAPEAGGSGVQEIEGAMENLRPVRWQRVLPVKFIAGIAALSSGLVLGREGPTIHIGASFSAAIAQFFRVSDTERRGLLGAGAAAGLACAFNAPLAAILFIIEETHNQFPYTFRTYVGVIVAALASTVATEIIGGTAPDLSMVVAEPSLTLIPAFILLGIVLGVIGVSLNASLMHMTAFSAKLHRRVPYLYPAIVGLAVGACFILLPQAVTGGETLIMQLSMHRPALLLLLVLAVMRYFTMVASYSTGTPGGIFAPMLALAICIGLSFGSVLEMVFPTVGISALAFGMAAMGGLFAASVRAPVVGVALTLELTGSYTMTLPLIATCVTANLVAQWIGGQPIYEQLLKRTLEQAGIDPARTAERPYSGLG
ncbi:H(+)/Cl(-) exchange transporter ClcA [Martelella sp. HB161492]|uniref:H(+)/Cl(-) exchange transporter ClcA n=1 Tax=Martelella sp. HB161492 TaxID=2720726 RepID=UPI00159136B7|nr:H(+)/Cl(-) exchange transporter ClcA [Martelella sp. HB161492]